MTFEKYTSLPSDVEAIQFTEENKNMVLQSLTIIHKGVGAAWENETPVLKLMTIHNEIATARPGDWIVKEPKLGYYYPVANDVFLKNMREKMNWIKIEDAVPETNKWVLSSDGKNAIGISRRIMWNGDFNWTSCFATSPFVAGKILFWAHLPEPPKRNEQS